MKIYSYKKGSISYEKNLIQALDIDLEKDKIITLVGAGGKTSTIFELGKEFSNLNKKTIDLINQDRKAYGLRDQIKVDNKDNKIEKAAQKREQHKNEEYSKLTNSEYLKSIDKIFDEALEEKYNDDRAAVCVASGAGRSGLGTVENRNKDNTGGIS